MAANIGSPLIFIFPLIFPGNWSWSPTFCQSLSSLDYDLISQTFELAKPRQVCLRFQILAFPKTSIFSRFPCLVIYPYPLLYIHIYFLSLFQYCSLIKFSNYQSRGKYVYSFKYWRSRKRLSCSCFPFLVIYRDPQMFLSVSHPLYKSFDLDLDVSLSDV